MEMAEKGFEARMPCFATRALHSYALLAPPALGMPTEDMLWAQHWRSGKAPWKK